MSGLPPDAQALQERARIAEQHVTVAKSREDALEAAITAAESYMRAMKLTDNATDKKVLDTKCKGWIDTAEKMKNERDWKSVSSIPKAEGIFLKKPLSTRELTTKEKIIILEGSKINGFLFPPWKTDPVDEAFILVKGEPPFEDSPRLDLSDEQLDIFDGWKRPSEAFSTAAVTDGHKEDGVAQATMKPLKPIDLVQDATSDCSIVASLCAGTARASKGHLKLLSMLMFPYDHQAKTPAISPSGKYILRLTFNGCERRVVIDDFLPTSKTSRYLHVIDRNNPGLLWPALMEKAYLKVRGGYDFPGSNSGTDLATLTGWIPEQVFLHDDDVLPRELWKRIYSAFGHGDVLITIGTGKLSQREQSQLGLAGEHDYAIIDMRETDETSEMLIKNPWSDGEIWKGKSRKEESQADSNQASLEPGTFWMDFGSVFQHFENLYLNWNPGLFTHREDIHFTWDLSSDEPELPGYFSSNPQFAIKTSSTGPVWLLISKHFKTGEYSSRAPSHPGYISLYLYANDGQQVFISDGAIKRGPFVDAPNTLLKAELPKNTPHTVVIASQSLPPSKYNFTLSAFSRTSLTLSPARPRYAHTVTKSSFWTPSTSGGNSDSPSYLTNPQFSLSLPSPSSVAIMLSTPHASLAIHAKVLFASTNAMPASSPRRLTTLRSRDVLAHTGEYRRFCVVTETHLPAGLYTIIVSTFEPPQQSSSSHSSQSYKYNFLLSASTNTTKLPTLSLLPSESSGRISTLAPPIILPLLSHSSPSSSPSPEQQQNPIRLLTPLSTPRLNRAIFLTHPPLPSSISNLTLHLEQSQGPYKTILTSSSTTSSSPSSPIATTTTTITNPRLPDTSISPSQCDPSNGGLWLVVEFSYRGTNNNNNNNTRNEITIQIEALSEDRLDFGAWGFGSG